LYENFRLVAMTDERVRRYTGIFGRPTSLFGLKIDFRRIIEFILRRVWRCSCVRLQLHRKWIDLDEIWSTLSTLSGAGPGRFWAQSAQYW